MAGRRAGLFLLIAAALILRLYRIDAWLPHVLLDADEMLYVSSGMEALEGLAPRKLEVPGSAYTLLLAGLYALKFVWTHVAGIAQGAASWGLFSWITSLNEFFISFYRDPSAQILLARGASAFFGALSIAAAYRLGGKLAAGGSWAAAILLLFSPFHVANAHYASSNTLAGFFYLLALIQMCSVAREGRQKNYLWGGVWTGLAMAGRINTAPLLAGLVCAHLLGPARERPLLRRLFDNKLGLGLLSAALTFYAACPYLLTAGLLFAKEFGFRVLFPGPHTPLMGESFEIASFLLRSIGLFPFGLALAAIAAAVVHKDGARLAVAAVLGADFLLVSRFGFLYERYALSMSLGMLILASACLADLIRAPRPIPRWAGWGGAVLATLLLAVPTLRHNASLNRGHTALAAREWVLSNWPGGGARLLVPMHLVALPESRESLRRRRGAVLAPDAPREKFRVQTGEGKPLSGLFAEAAGHYRAVVRSDMILHEEWYLERELAFKLADPAPPEPSFELQPFGLTELFGAVSRADAVQKFAQGDCDGFIDTEPHPGLGNPAAAFLPDAERAGPPVYIYAKRP